MNAPVRAFAIERRDLSTSGRMKAKPDAILALREIADSMRHMPRECAVDRAELLLWLSRMARKLDSIALDGFETAPARHAVASRQPLVGRPRADPRAIAEAVFSGIERTRAPRTQTTTVRSRKGATVKVEVRRRRTRIDPNQIPLF